MTFPTHLTLSLRSYSDQTYKHHHDFHQIVLPVKGTLEMVVRARGGEVHQHQAALIAAGNEHDFSATGDNVFVVADIAAALAPGFDRAPPFITLEPVLSHYTQFLYRSLLHDGTPYQNQRQMLLLLIQLLCNQLEAPVGVDRRLAAILHYLDKNLALPITLEQLAIVGNLSVRQLTALFRKQLNISPMQYLANKRMQMAKELLNTTNLDIQRIAQCCGYGNLSAFSNRFHHHFGQSPRNYRRISKELRW